MSGHTELPWNVRDHSTATGARHIWVEGGPAIGETRAGPYKRQILEDEDYDEKAADAALIVTACNSHADLVRALQFYASEWQPNGEGDPETPGLSRSWVGPTDELHNDGGRKARAALATLTARKVG